MQNQAKETEVIMPADRKAVCHRCLVSGRVQGVFYRASTRSRAEALGLTGYAKNLPDGRVEVLACGEPEAVRQLCDWLWEGPPAARVETVECREVDEAPPSRFGSG
jgi:acylphosphatase